jgi:hypothetical protein
MKKLFESWRRYVGEGILQEVPLEGFGKYGDEGDEKFKSIAYDQVDDPDYVKRSVALFEKVPDPFYIIVVDNVGQAGRGLPPKLPEIKNWVEQKMCPESGEGPDDCWRRDAKFLVVGHHSLSDDYEGPEWQLVHDVIGHSAQDSVYRNLEKVPVTSGGYDNWWATKFLSKYYKEKDVAHRELQGIMMEEFPKAIHQALPEHLRLGETEDDLLPDILGAIFVGDFGPEDADKVDLEYLRDLNPDISPLGLREQVKTAITLYKKYLLTWWEDQLNPKGEISVLIPF